VYRHPCEIVASYLALACMHSGAHLEPEVARAGADRERALDGARRAVERNEELITLREDLAAAELPDGLAHRPLVAIEESRPRPVTDSASISVERTTSVNRTIASTPSLAGLCRP
jgi:hypothetical protein